MARVVLSDQIPHLLRQHHSLTANQVLAELEKTGKSYNKTSVYRAIDQLLAQGVLCAYHFQDNETSYELRDHHHAHLVCERCGAVTVSECGYDQPAMVGGFHVEHHHLTLYGVCVQCLATGAMTPAGS